MFTRRTATVTISAPEASCARAITAFDGYLPVPTMRREWKLLPASVSKSSCIGRMVLRRATANGVDYLDPVAVADHRGAVRGAFQNLKVVLDRHAPFVDLKIGEQLVHCQRAIDLHSVAVERDIQTPKGTGVHPESQA